jgi:hypothetical protein
MWRVILSHLFGALHQECKGQFYSHTMAHASREPLLEPSHLPPHTMAQDEQETREKLSQAEIIFAKSPTTLQCKFWNETSQILLFLLLIDCFCDAEKAGCTRA